MSANAPTTRLIASQNQRKTFKKRLRKLRPLFVRAARVRGARVDVADAADGLDSLELARAPPELLAEVAYVHVYASVEDGNLPTERGAHEVFARDDAARGREEYDEYLVLHVRQLDRLAVAAHVARARVGFNVPDRNALGRGGGGGREVGARRRARATQHGLYARYQLARVEGLRQVVVCAYLQTDDAVNVVAARRQHQDVYARALGAESAQHLEAVHAGHHHVQYDE